MNYGGGGTDEKSGTRVKTDLKKINVYFPDDLIQPPGKMNPEQRAWYEGLSPEDKKVYLKIVKDYKVMQKAGKALVKFKKGPRRKRKKPSPRHDTYVGTVSTSSEGWKRRQGMD